METETRTFQYEAGQDLLKSSVFKFARECLRIGQFLIQLTDGKYDGFLFDS